MASPALIMERPPFLPLQVYRRFAAAVVLNSIQCASRLGKGKMTPEEYFDSVEALLWIKGPESNHFFEFMSLEREECMERIGISTLAIKALDLLGENQKIIVNYHVATRQYILESRNKKSAYTEHLAYADLMLGHLIGELQQLADMGLVQDPHHPVDIPLDPGEVDGGGLGIVESP